MRVLAWDVGIINLAYCILDQTESGLQVIEWKVITFIEGDYRKISPENLRIALIKKLDETRDKFLDVDIVLVENQPVLKNPTMKSISSCIFDYFLIRGKIDSQNIKSVIFTSPVNKLRLNILDKEDIEKLKTTTKSKYTLNKKIAVQTCTKMLTTLSCSDNIFESSKKKDDLADCLLLAYHYCQKHACQKN